MRICKVKDCERKHEAQGYCTKHYWRFKIYGDPLFTKREMHGMCNIQEYKIWRSMKSRCYHKNDHNYNRYGGRGIAVCDRWRNSFMAFYKDMGKKSFPKACLDRINNDGNYEPGNCRWTTAAKNCQHQSTTKLSMKKAIAIRAKYKKGDIIQLKLASLYGVGQGHVSQIVNNKAWA